MADLLRPVTPSVSTVAVDLHTTGLMGPRLPLAAESTLYRLVQETLTVILKHARASGLSLTLERTAVEVRLIVEDDGAETSGANP